MSVKWLSIVQKEDAYYVRLDPNFFDLSKTDFPEGFCIFGLPYFSLEDAEHSLELGEEFFKSMIADLKDNENCDGSPFDGIKYMEAIQKKYYAMKNKENVFAHVYSSGNTLYLRLFSVCMDTEATGFSHGITINDFNFETTREDYKEIKKECILLGIRIDNLMMDILRSHPDFK